MNLQVPIQKMKEEGIWPLSWTSAVGLVPLIKNHGTLNYFRKVKRGGIFAGHDYSWEGVARAVLEFRSELKILHPLQRCANDVWYWIKE